MKKKRNWFIYFVVVVDYLVFNNTSHTSKLHQTLKMQNGKQFKVTFLFSSFPIPPFLYLGYSYIDQGFLYYSRDILCIYKHI